ncbi:MULTISPECIES: DUF397 domain-containing protein [unclassified Streptomyces]|uniref:DUF397 domain-containing protein n=1 Tax=unclassified Streptomyces TaxID=2593676 RepID=UPI002E1473F6|nr:DUF397 domain-containing protein [Streptomyces sp. NBC_01197]WSS49789.1 DUF397 domain-containing protein [Streptomyces sp. NBC_01180]
MKRTHDLSIATWLKSSYSDGGDNNCVEVTHDYPGIIPVRDSKTAPTGPALIFPGTAWTTFIQNVREEAR